VRVGRCGILSSFVRTFLPAVAGLRFPGNTFHYSPALNRAGTVDKPLIRHIIDLDLLANRLYPGVNLISSVVASS